MPCQSFDDDTISSEEVHLCYVLNNISKEQLDHFLKDNMSLKHWFDIHIERDIRLKEFQDKEKNDG